MEDFKIVRQGARSYNVQLSIPLQMELGLYVEPIPGVPSTFESDEKIFTTTDDELNLWLVRLCEQTSDYRSSVRHVIALQEMGVTYADTHRIFAKTEPPFAGKEPYNADEDLAFLYSRLGVLYRFAFEVGQLLTEDMEVQ